MYKRGNYFKWCIVPECKSTSVKNPEKEFIIVPRDAKTRNTWMRSIRRDPKDIALKTVCYVCEDHFDLQEDMENYLRWKLVGGPKSLKKNVVPHKFDCQVDRRRKLTTRKKYAVIDEEENKNKGQEQPLEEPIPSSQSEAQIKVEQALADGTSGLKNLEEQLHEEVKLEFEDAAEDIGQPTTASSKNVEDLLIEEVEMEFDDAAEDIDEPITASSTNAKEQLIEEVKLEFDGAAEDIDEPTTASSKNVEKQLTEEVKLEFDDAAEDIAEPITASFKNVEEHLIKEVKSQIGKEAAESVGRATNKQSLSERNSIPIKDERLDKSSSSMDKTHTQTKENHKPQCRLSSLDCMTKALLEQYKKDYRDILTLFSDIRLLDLSINRLNAHRSHLTNLLEEVCSVQMASEESADKQQSVVSRRKENAIKSDKEIDIDIKMENDETAIEMEEAENVPASLAPEENAVVLHNAGEQLIVGTNFGNIYYAKVENQFSFHRKIEVTDGVITAIQLVNVPELEKYMFVGASESILKLYSFQWARLLGNIPLEAPARCMDWMWDIVFIGCSNGIYCRLSQKKGKVEFAKMNSREDVLALKATHEGSRQVLIVGQRDSPILILDAFSGFLLRQFANAVVSTVYSIALDGGQFYCGSAHNGILKYTFRAHHLEEVLQTGTKAGVSCLKITKNKLFAGCLDGHVYIIGLKTGNTHILKGRGGNITCMEIINDKIIVGSMSDPMDSIPIPDDIIRQE